MASQELSFPRAASLEEIRSNLFVQLFLHNGCFAGEDVKVCISMKNSLVNREFAVINNSRLFLGRGNPNHTMTEI